MDTLLKTLRIMGLTDAALGYIKWGILWALLTSLVILSGVVYWQNGTIADLREDVGAKAVEITVLTAERDDLSDKLKKQSDKITELKMASELASEEARRAIQEERQRAAKWQTRYSTLLNAPKPSGDDCEGLGLLLDQYISVRREEGR